MATTAQRLSALEAALKVQRDWNKAVNGRLDPLDPLPAVVAAFADSEADQEVRISDLSDRVAELEGGIVVPPPVDPPPVDPPPVDPPPPPVIVPTTRFYGSGIGMDALNNTQIGGSGNQSASYRFRAATSAKLNSIRVYIIGPTHSGYGAGTGGTWRVTVRPDDGSSAHGPSLLTLATTDFHPVDDFPVISWASPATLTAGQLYHVVFVNVDANPTANYASLDGVFMYSPTSPRQPAFADVDWGQPERFGSAAWADTRSTIPIAQLNYAGGVSQGLGYMENWDGDTATISGASKVREAFTVSGANRQVTTVSVRLKRVSGSDPLTVRLETSAGALIEEGTISVPSTTRQAWVTYTFATPRTLTSGQAYNLVISAPSGSSFTTWAIRKGVGYGFSGSTYFGDGHGQKNTGGGWVAFSPWGSPVDQGDLQFYFGMP